MGVIRRKVWRDLARNKVRTALVVLSIAVGVLALGLAFGTHGVMHVYLAQENEFSQTANITFKGDRLSQQAVEAVLREPGVAGAELETVAAIRWRLPEETAWRQGIVIARPDYGAQQVSLVELLEGSWPGESVNPCLGGYLTLAVERQTSRHFGVPLDASIVVETGRGERVCIGGVVRKPYVSPPQYGAPGTFYATPEMIARLTRVRDPNKLYVRSTPGAEGVDVVQERVKDRLERMGISVSGSVFTTESAEFDVDLLADQLDALFLILEVLGTGSLGVSAFLIVNTMSAIIVQQVWQIGVIKVVGATFWRVVRIYLSVALIYGLLALLLAVPLALAGAYAMAGWLLETFNIIAAGDFRVSPAAVAIQVAMALVTPLLAAAVPVIAGVRISPHQAISTYGLGGRFGRGPLDRLVGRVRFLQRPMALSLRNVFRRKVRVALTLLTFVLVGVMFIAIVSTRSSLGNAVEMALQKGFVHDVLVVSSRHYRVDHLVDVTQGAPGVSKVEVWDQVVADLLLSSSHERGRESGEKEILVYGVPTDSEALRPDIVAGRDLLPGEGRAILVNRQMAAEQGIQVGDELVLTIGGRESTWTVVGVTWEVTLDLGSFVPYETLAREAGHAGQGNTVIVTSEAHDAPSRERLVADLRDVYETQRIETATLRSVDELRQTLYTTIDGISYLLLAMAFLAAVVGGIGLVGTLSINVVERMREIGVMRASGAVSSDIFGIFVGEGVFLGVLSWVLAVPLSYPWAHLFSEAVSLAVFNTEPDFRYSVPSVVVWLMLVLVLSVLASLWPAWRATRVSVREALAYE